MSVTVRVMVDFPETTQVVTLPADAEYGQLTAAVAMKGLETVPNLFEYDLADYDVVVAAYGTDCRRHEHSSDLQKKSLADLGISHHCSVVLCAPAQIKPRPEPKVAEEEEESDDEEDTAKKYKGLSVKNILDKYDQAKGQEKQVCLEYIEIVASKLFKLPEWAKLPAELVVKILGLDRLNCPETEVLAAAVTWGRAECKREDKKENDLKEVLESKGVIQQIRFPTMSSNDLATMVAMTGLLSSTQMLDMFTYIGQKSGVEDEDANIALPESLKAFKTKPRNPRELYAYEFGLGPGTMQGTSDWQVMSSTDFTDPKLQKAIVSYYLARKGKEKQQGFKLLQSFSPSNIMATREGYIYMQGAYVSWGQGSSSYSQFLSGDYVLFKNHSTNAAWPLDKDGLTSLLSTTTICDHGNYTTGNNAVAYKRKRK